MGKARELESVLSCNPYTLACYSSTLSELHYEAKPKYHKHQKSFSYLTAKSFIHTQVTVSSNIEDEDLFDIIENAAYDELGLDLTSEYKIDYFERPNEHDSANRLFEVFIAEPAILEETFEALTSQIRYIDEIIPQPLLLQTLYKKEILEADKTDLFIYFSEHDAFLTLYKEGEFLYTKDLNFSIQTLYDLYCQICGDRIEFEDFLDILIQHGLRTEDEEQKSFLIKLITELLSQINEILNFAKRTFELTQIDRIYIGTDRGPIHGIDEFSQTILGIESLNFDFDYGFENLSGYVDQIHQLLQLTASLDKETRYNCNLTLFPAPPPLLQRPSGRLLTITAASLIISLVLPLYNLGYAAFASLTLSSLQQEQRGLRQQKLQREHAINDLVAKRKELNTLKQEAIDTQKSQKQVLNKIYIKKVQYPMKAKIIADLTQDLNSYNVQLMQIDYQSSAKDASHSFILKLTAANEKNITTMIEKLTRHDLEHYDTTIQEIVYSDTLGLYLCELKVELKFATLNLESKVGS